ncbi:MAG: right-handed parallel beta-helix repeat-containing protein, partial [Bacteroidetes bacterium]|nr:right-handed parallel beta-helix repeat-containing protein [Bacteroidota bacterium]
MLLSNTSLLSKLPSGIATIALLCLTSPGLTAGDTISVSDFGLLPDARENSGPYVIQAIEECRKSENPVLVFPEGRYDFWPSDCQKDRFIPGHKRIKNPVPVGIFVDGLDNLEINGDGSLFVFHGNMMSVGVKNSANTTIRNVTIDWDRPFVSQAVVESAGDGFLDIRIDPCEYPYMIENQDLIFTGEGWRDKAAHHCLFDKDKKEIVYRTRDNPLGIIEDYEAEELAPGSIRLKGSLPFKPEAGTYIAFYNGRQAYFGVGLNKNQNTVLENVTIHHSPGTGVYSFFCDGLVFRKLKVAVNEEKGRVFSALADATYFVNCKGKVLVEECHHTGQTDDWANFRGTYTIISEILSENRVAVRYKWHNVAGFYNPGDEVWLVNTRTMERTETRIVKGAKDLESGDTEVVFTSPLPEDIQTGYALENRTWMPEVEVRNCVIPKRNRARGILISTPKKALIHSNHFGTAGTAILIEGDVDRWYEAGAINNLEISNNTFDNCLSSGSDESNFGWGEAIITITPSRRPQSTSDEPYHKNIIIKNNRFETFDTPLVRARSVRNLQFINNTIIRTFDYKPYAWQKSSFLLDGCRDVEISGNSFSDQYKTRTIDMEHMKKSDL